MIQQNGGYFNPASRLCTVTLEYTIENFARTNQIHSRLNTRVRSDVLCDYGIPIRYSCGAWKHRASTCFSLYKYARIIYNVCSKCARIIWTNAETSSFNQRSERSAFTAPLFGLKGEFVWKKCNVNSNEVKHQPTLKPFGETQNFEHFFLMIN